MIFTAHRRLALHAAVMLVLVRAARGHIAFPALRGALARHGAKRRMVRDRAAVLAAVHAAARCVPGHSSCLDRALVAVTLLERCGHRPALRLGVARGGAAGLEAHAWVELDGEVVLGAPEPGRWETLPPLALRVESAR